MVVTIQRLDPIATPTAAPAATPAATAPWTQRTDAVTVNTGQPTGTDSAMKVKTGQKVTVTVRGSYASGPVQADAFCVVTGAGWAPYDPQVLGGQEPLELWVDGQRIEWHALSGTTPCAADHAYSTSVHRHQERAAAARGARRRPQRQHRHPRRHAVPLTGQQVQQPLP